MIKKLREELKKRVSEQRYVHTLGMEEKAIELGKKYGIDLYKIRISALLHDIAKNMSLEEMKKICKENFLSELSDEDMNSREIMHGFVGSIIAKKEFGINDEEILNGIKYHTIGEKNLNLFGKIIYIADAIEKNRSYPNVEKIRKITEKNLDEGIIFEIDKKMEYLKSLGKKTHQNTIEMRDKILDSILKGVIK